MAKSVAPVAAAPVTEPPESLQNEPVSEPLSSGVETSA